MTPRFGLYSILQGGIIHHMQYINTEFSGYKVTDRKSCLVVKSQLSHILYLPLFAITGSVPDSEQWSTSIIICGTYSSR